MNPPRMNFRYCFEKYSLLLFACSKNWNVSVFAPKIQFNMIWIVKLNFKSNVDESAYLHHRFLPTVWNCYEFHDVNANQPRAHRLKQWKHKSEVVHVETTQNRSTKTSKRMPHLLWIQLNCQQIQRPWTECKWAFSIDLCLRPLDKRKVQITRAYLSLAVASWKFYF